MDCQAIYLGSSPQKDLIRSVGRLLRHGDAPTRLTHEQKAKVDDNRRLVDLRSKRDRVRAKIKTQGYSTLKDAEGTPLFRHHARYKKEADSLRNQLRSRRLDRAITEFHDLVHREDVDEQLRGFHPSEILAPVTMRRELPERTKAARLFMQAVSVSDHDEIYKLRIDLVKTLAQLCKCKSVGTRRRLRSRIISI